MAVRIREKPYQTSSGAATYQVRPDEVRGHLMIIAAGGTGDLEPSFGDNPDPADSDYSVLVYNPSPAPDTSTPSGRVRERLKTLVDESAKYDIIGVPGDTLWSDGSNVEAQPAFTLGNTVFYDTSSCNGDGRWIRGTNGEEECTQSAVILFHELAHAFHDHGAGDLAQEEAEAIDDENNLREALGLVPRDRTRLEGECGCSDDACCIVASVACGTPYAEEINALRRLRDHRLRETTLGSAFFDALHREYYAFSVEVCRIMVTDKHALQDVRAWLVRPLAGILTVVADHTTHSADPAYAGALLLRHLRASRASLPDHGIDWTSVRQLLEALSLGLSPAWFARSMPPGTLAVCEVLARALPASPHVRWGIITPLIIHAMAAAQFGTTSDTDADAAGRWLDERIHTWLAAMPLDEIIAAVPTANVVAEISALAGSVFPTEPGRSDLTRRLVRGRTDEMRSS